MTWLHRTRPARAGRDERDHHRGQAHGQGDTDPKVYTGSNGLDGYYDSLDRNAGAVSS
jgi:hypothetical protein